MTSKQRIAFWRRVSKCFDRHEREMIEQNKKSRIDIIGQNGNTGEHYAEVEKAQLNNRGNWYGLADDWDKEEDATSMDDDLPSAAEDCAKQRGSYEI